MVGRSEVAVQNARCQVRMALGSLSGSLEKTPMWNNFYFILLIYRERMVGEGEREKH